MEELVTDEFVFTGIVQVPVKEAKKNDLGTTTSTPEPAPQTTVSAVPSATCNVAPRPNGSVTSAYPMHHHHHHYHQPSHQKQQQQQQQPPLQSPPVQHQEQHSWSAGYHEHHYRQYRGVHHHHHHQQAQQPYNRAGATGKVYQDAYNPVDYDMNVCAPPYYPRMYNRYPGMHMGPGAYLNMGDFTGFSLQHQSPYFPPQQVQPNSFTPPPPASQQAWMRGDGTLPNARRVDGNPPWYPGAHPGFNDAMSAWKQMRNNVWSKPPEQGGAPTAP
uniref:Uncharacterized protein n=1 Tax=Trypanosoma congolense (strain IL3000) TaxID=1068625 RepID=G0UJ30_TRYCI|nr:conserved hypothetical protein [Trypanosoma congolense IL3000]